MAAFRQGLGDSGFVEGQNIAIEYRWAENRYERLPEMANELVRRQVAVLVASCGDHAALAAQAASASIPIVFSAGGDPVANGLVASVGRPGANLTGVSLLTTLLEAKRLSLLREALPAATRIGLLVNPGGTIVQSMVQESEQAARSLGVRLVVVKAQAESDFEAVFAGLSGYAPLLLAQTPVTHPHRIGVLMPSTRAKDDVLNMLFFDPMRHQGGGSFANS